MINRWHHRVVQIWRRQVRPIVFVVLVLMAFRSAIADWNDVPSGSMRPTILEGDRIFVNKLAYDLKVPFTTWHLAQWGNPQRGDVVVFFSPVDGTRMVKRVVGMPGETIEMRNDRLFINSEPAKYQVEPDPLPAAGPGEPAGRAERVLAVETIGSQQHTVALLPGIAARRTFGPIVIPSGQYFLMGDNRDNSNDSRYWGPASRESIVGRASTVVLSLDPDSHYWPRWSRFMHSLP